MSVKQVPYSMDDFFRSDEARLETAALLTGRPDAAEVSLDYVNEVKIAFPQGRPYKALLKRGWEGPLREAVGIECAEFLGARLYDAVAGKSFLLMERVRGTPVFEERVPRLAGQFGLWDAYFDFLGYSDASLRNFVERTDGELTAVDWGTVFTYVPLERVLEYANTWSVDELRGLLRRRRNAENHEAGLDEGRKRILERYSAAGAPVELAELMEPINLASYSDEYVRFHPLAPDFPTGRAAVRRALSKMEKLARRWEKELA